MKCTPVVIKGLKEPVKYLERVESRKGDEKTEDWLQVLLFNNPGLLPISDFDDSFSPLIPLAREVPTLAGDIDILYVSPLGKFTVVETKLWKNPEKHRTVVAQVIDYAKEMSRWSYSNLDEALLQAWRRSNVTMKSNMEELVKPYLSDAGVAVADFQEQSISCLETGEFLLLIVGDKISPNLALLTEAIHGAPGLDFHIELVELQFHQIEKNRDWPLLVLPDVVGRTVEKTRGVIRIKYEKEKPLAEVTISDETETPETKGKTTPELFLQKVPDDLRPIYEQWLNARKDEKGSVIYWGTTGFSFRILKRTKLATILEAYPDWAVSLVRDSDQNYLGASREQYQQYLNDVNEIPAAYNVLSLNKKFVRHEQLTAEALHKILNATSNLAESLKD